jgi:hypothetical protein
MPSRLDKEQTHGRKPGKGGSSSARGSTSKGATTTTTTTQAHDISHSPKHSTISAPKQQSAKVRSASPTSDKQQEQLKPRSKSPPNSTDHSIRSCLFINNII